MAISKIKTVILTLSILVVLVFFVFYGISVVYEEPAWDKFCPQRSFDSTETKEQCDSVGGQWNPTPVPCPEAQKCPKGYCDAHYQCNKEFNDTQQVYERNVFMISIIIGSLLLILGLILKGQSVSLGIMGGGFVIMIYSLGRYWGFLSKYVRLLVLGVILALLIWVAHSKVDQHREPSAYQRKK